MSISQFLPQGHREFSSFPLQPHETSRSPKPIFLVTGATGFLGGYILKNLLKKGYAVRAVRRKTEFPFNWDGDFTGVVEWVNGDILDVKFVEEILKEVDYIIHAAAMVSFSSKQRAQMYQVNIEGTANIVNMAIENKVARLLHVSSVAALGRTKTKELVDEQRKWEDNTDMTHYAISKHRGEMQVWRAFAEGLNGIIINPSTILGYGNWHQSSCALFKSSYKEFPWYPTGVNGFVGVEDVAEVVVQLLMSDLNHQKFLVNADNWSFQQLGVRLADHFNKKRPSRKAGYFEIALAWRAEYLKSLLSGNPALLTRETAKLALSQTMFSNAALKTALPAFEFTPLDRVIESACVKYLMAVANGTLSL
ncbi:MAG: NAD-dependent epimerase/dehydratase family protein [Flavisolibacter sp.]